MTSNIERDPLGPCCDDPRWSGERGGPGYLECHTCGQPYRSGYRTVPETLLISGTRTGRAVSDTPNIQDLECAQRLTLRGPLGGGRWRITYGGDYVEGVS